VAQRGAAEIHVLMPLRDAQRNAPIQIVFGESSRSRIHHADEAIAVAVFLIEQGRGMLGVEPGGCFGSVGVVCKVILLLRDPGKEYFETVVERDVVVLVFFHHGAGSFGDLLARSASPG